MAFGWITALKIIPWKDVLESAPHIVKAAKNLYAGTRTNASNLSETPDSPTSTSDSESLGSLIPRLHKIASSSSVEPVITISHSTPYFFLNS